MTDALAQSNGFYTPFGARGASYEDDWVGGEKEEIDVEGDASLEQYLDRFSEISSLPRNWDSYGAEPVNRRTLVYAVKVFLTLMEGRTIEPFITPTPDGGISIEWSAGQRGLDVEILGPFRVNAHYFAGEGEDPWDRSVGPEYPKLSGVLDNLTA